jgi:transcriptional regulator with XRE-family HTH domain
MTRKSAVQLEKEGEEFKTYRVLMGMKQLELAEMFKIKQSYLSKMEGGRESLGARLDIMREMFKEWRTDEIKRLNDRIEYLHKLL